MSAKVALPIGRIAVRSPWWSGKDWHCDSCGTTFTKDAATIDITSVTPLGYHSHEDHAGGKTGLVVQCACVSPGCGRDCKLYEVDYL